MKRLIRKATVSLYHGTSVENLKGITSDNALIPNKSSGAGKNINHDGSQFGGFVFLATNLLTALNFANYIPPHNTESHIVIEMMLPEDKLLPDNDDCQDCNTWQESSERIGQVKVDGQIDASNFTQVYFYDRWTGELLLQSSFNDWETNYLQNRHLFIDDEE